MRQCHVLTEMCARRSQLVRSRNARSTKTFRADMLTYATTSTGSRYATWTIPSDQRRARTEASIAGGAPDEHPPTPPTAAPTASRIHSRRDRLPDTPWGTRSFVILRSFAKHLSLRQFPSMDTPRFDAQTIVVGAGAAGLMAATTAARSGGDVLLIERTSDGGRKILISGGGRCNILPHVLRPERYVTDSSPNTLRKLLRAWPLDEQKAFFEEELGSPLVLEEETAKLFPSSHRARDVRDMLVRRFQEAGGRTWFQATVCGLRPDDDGWIVELEGAPSARSRSVIVATGGLSVPKTGSDGIGLGLIEALGHAMHETYPALTPLVADPHPQVDLAGVSGPVTITAPGTRPAFDVHGGFLITHDGWSGPTVLDASHLAIRGRSDGSRQELLIGWSAEDPETWDERLRGAQGTVRSTVARVLPKRLADWLVDEAGVDPSTSLAQLKKSDRRALVAALASWPLPWTGSAGYKKAEVTGGGVALDQIHPRTMESRICPGLYLCGEILDAFGPIGGHNFAWAWSTGRVAGLASQGEREA